MLVACGGSLLSGDFAWSGGLRPFGAELHEADQKLVAFCLQLCDGARSDFGMDAVDQLALELWRHVRRAKCFPPAHHRAEQSCKGVLDAARTATEVIKHHVAHDSPAQARSPGESRVDISGVDDALG